MDPSLQTWLWLAAALLLLGSELAVPSLSAAFFGLGALTVAALRALGVVESTGASLALLAGSSTLYLLLLRRVFSRWIGHKPERSRQSVDEDARAFGALVEVLDDVGDEAAGRIRFDGTTWAARTESGLVRRGERARLLYRDNLVWVVAPVSPADEPLAQPLPSLPLDT